MRGPGALGAGADMAGGAHKADAGIANGRLADSL